MALVRELTRSVEWIWIAWLVSLLLLAVWSIRLGNRLRWPGWGALIAGENGASYSLAYVLTFPLYLLLVCVVIETTLILYVKMGTVYAAYAGARAAIVWIPADTTDLLRQRRIQQAVNAALAPFASGKTRHAELYGVNDRVNSRAETEADDYVQAFQKFAGPSLAAAKISGFPSDSYLKRKYLFARYQTKITCKAAPISLAHSIDPNRPSLFWPFLKSEPESDVTVEVTYKMPLYTPGAGRILVGGDFPYAYPITSKATLPNEAPISTDPIDSTDWNWSLGIDYRSE